MNATLGSAATFFCSAFKFQSWNINGTDVDDPSLNDRGIEPVTPSSNDSELINSTLTVRALAENHGAVIQCLAGPPAVFSKEAMLRIQGM